MKTKIVHKEKEVEKPFPKTMRSGKGTVVFFYEADCGVCLVKSPLSYVGKHSSTWDMCEFKDWEGVIEFTNE